MSNFGPDSELRIVAEPTAKFIMFLASVLFGFIMAHHCSDNSVLVSIVGIVLSILYTLVAALLVGISELLIKWAYPETKQWSNSNRFLAGAVWPATLSICLIVSIYALSIWLVVFIYTRVTNLFNWIYTKVISLLHESRTNPHVSP